MLIHPTINKLKELRLKGMASALEDQIQMPDIETLTFDDRLGLMVDRETTDRESRRLATRLRKAKLRQNACFEDLDFRKSRGLDKLLITTLQSCDWIKDSLNLLLTGATGTGKTWLACAFAQKACREGYTAIYVRLPRMFQDLHIAKADGRYVAILNSMAKTKLLIFDDWGLNKFTKEQCHDLLEILEDRHNSGSTIITSQFPVGTWHDLIGDPTFADAIMDRLIHNAYKIDLKGESMRKKKSRLTNKPKSE